MCFTLIFVRKVKINIWLFISFESKECLKRYIKAQLIQLMPTLRALLIWHITTCTTCEFLYFI